MALTVTDPLGIAVPFGDRWLTIREVDFDTSYPTGGEPLTYKQLGFVAKPDIAIALPRLGFTFEYDKANEKLIARALSVAGGAAAAGTDALSIKAGVLNKESATAANVGLPQATSTADLSSLTDVVVLTIGKYPA